MGFSAWFEVYLGGRWWTLDARHNTPRIGRVLMSTGRDASDCAITTSFGQARSIRFQVTSEEVPTSRTIETTPGSHFEIKLAKCESEKAA
jgi:transglutaminase-like putative cysteine protease